MRVASGGQRKDNDASPGDDEARDRKDVDESAGYIALVDGRPQRGAAWLRPVVGTALLETRACRLKNSKAYPSASEASAAQPDGDPARGFSLTF